MTYDTLDCFGYPEGPRWDALSLFMAGLLLAAILAGLMGR